MTDVDKLLAMFESGELLRPSAETLNVVDLAHALAALAGAPPPVTTAGAAKLASLIGPADHLVFVLADGLGMESIEELPRGTFLAAHLATELRTVFPSTTAVVLTTFATGAWPGVHGVTGQWTHIPELGNAGAVLPFTTRTGGRSLRTLGVTVEQVFPLPAWMAGVPRDTLALLPEQILDSAFSTYSVGGQPRQGYRTLGEAIDSVIARVRVGTQPTYTYLYVPRVDLEAHRNGVRQSGVQAALQELDHELERLARGVAGRGRIVLSADHGLSDTPVASTHWMRPSADLFEVLRYPPSGDARVMYLHVRDGARERIRRSFKDHYGGRFLVIAIDEADDLRLFGPEPLSPYARARVGDLVVISTGVDVIEYAPTRSTGRILGLASHHSGLTPAEMRVPLVLA